MTASFGGMELLGRLSAGGMGEVLLARRRGAHGFEKLIAVKTIRADLFQRDDIRRMFLDEARLMARLDHPAIAQVYDFGEEKDVLYLAMEYVPGIVLWKLMKLKPAGLPPAVALRIASEVCRGLHAAHELPDDEGRPFGVVHRDISPHNLMITFDGKVKILDFGIAMRRGREAPETELGIVKGKAMYIAPEQLAQETIDRRSDLYSVAVVLHEMLTGKKLFSGTGRLDIDAEERRSVAPPSKIAAAVPAAVDALVMKGLAVDPAERFQDAREMALAIEREVAALGGETVEEFAARELAEERAQHRVRLLAVTSAAEPKAPPALLAAPPGPPPPAPSVSSELSLLDSADVVALDPSEPEPEPKPEPEAEPEPAQPARGVRVAVGIVAAFLLAAAVAVASRRTERPPPVMVADPPIVATPTVTKALVRELAQALDTISATTATAAATATASEALAVEETPPIPEQAQRPARRKPKRSGTGLITFDVEPVAIVLIDGKVAGHTPLRDVRLPAGKHEIQLRRPHSRALRLKRIVWVSENRPVKITAIERAK